MDGLVEQSEAGRAELTVALCVNFSHHHVVLTCRWRQSMKKSVSQSFINLFFHKLEIV